MKGFQDIREARCCFQISTVKSNLKIIIILCTYLKTLLQTLFVWLFIGVHTGNFGPFCHFAPPFCFLSIGHYFVQNNFAIHVNKLFRNNVLELIGYLSCFLMNYENKYSEKHTQDYT